MEMEQGLNGKESAGVSSNLIGNKQCDIAPGRVGEGRIISWVIRKGVGKRKQDRPLKGWGVVVVESILHVGNAA